MLNSLKRYFYFKIKTMEINWVVLGALAVFVIVFVVLTIKKNLKEKKKLTDLLNNDFKKAEKERVDFEDSANEK